MNYFENYIQMTLNLIWTCTVVNDFVTMSVSSLILVSLYFFFAWHPYIRYQTNYQKRSIAATVLLWSTEKFIFSMEPIIF